MNKRVAGPRQGMILLGMSCLPILGSLIIAPVLPAMEAAFAETEGVRFLVPLTLTIPSLAIAVISPVTFWLAARTGRKALMIAALCLYGVMGLLPLILNSLSLIVGSRVFLGVAEGIIITLSTALIGDYFASRTRERYLSIQVLLTSVSAVIFLLVGGWLGQHGWRVPFSIYVVSLVMVPFVVIGLWETKPRSANPAIKTARAFPWSSMVPFYIVAFFACLCFNLLSSILSYLVGDLGIDSSFVMGKVNALNSASIGVGTLVGFFLVHSKARMCGGMLLAAAGMLVVSYTDELGTLSIGTMMSGAGGGIFFAHLLSGSMRNLDADQLTRGTGIFMGSFYLANVIGPMSAIWIGYTWLGLRGAVGLFGIGLAVVSVAAWLLLDRFFAANKTKPEAVGI